jgi:hypothetical protein
VEVPVNHRYFQPHILFQGHQTRTPNSSSGILSDDISRDDQIVLALRLVTLAEHLKECPDSPMTCVSVR